jgi:eukaryotic-like serine/threonine-protein kinase
VKPTDPPDTSREPEVPTTVAETTLVRPASPVLAETLAARPVTGADPARPAAEARAFTARYEMREKLGEGGMGEVHLVLDRRIGREVALKAVHPGHRTRPDLHARFVREARVQGQLEHPSIVPVYELALEEDPAYFTMRRVRGVTLEEVIEAVRTGDAATTAARFSRRKLLTAFDNVCLAVDFAHSHGVVHRDLKPSNVMLGAFGEVHVLDWGIAKLSEGGEELEGGVVDAGDLSAKTAAGSFMGTLGYISPEQLRGDPTTPLADVYALGSILFEVLACEPLHPGSRTTEIVQSTLAGADARPSVRAPNREVPPELDAICVKATALDPSKRFASAREMHDAIERFLDGDRDVEQRRVLAQRHAEAALEAAARATREGRDGSDDDRTIALKEAARSLALDPTNIDAMKATLQLRAQPPRSFPRAVETQLAETQIRVLRSSSWFGAVIFAFVFAYIPLAFLMGLRELWFVLTTVGLFGVSVAILMARSRTPREWQMPALIVASMVPLGLMTRIAGPFALVPGLIVANTVAYAMLEARSSRWLALGAGCLAIFVPTILEWTGTFGSSYVFHDGTFTIVPHALSFPKTLTFAYFTMTSLGCVLAPFFFVGKLRAKLYEMQRTMTLQAWQFRQLVPEEVQEVAGASPLPR